MVCDQEMLTLILKGTESLAGFILSSYMMY